MRDTEAQVPEATPTPRPWEDDELSVRQALRLLGTHVCEELARIRGTLELELRGIHVALDALEDRSEDTGRHMIQVAGMAGEAKGLAEARSRRDSDPVKAFAVVVVSAVAKRVPGWAWPLLTAGTMYLLHRFGLLGH